MTFLKASDDHRRRTWYKIYVEELLAPRTETLGAKTLMTIIHYEYHPLAWPESVSKP